MEENKYNEDHVWYCKSCLSLKIINLGEDEIVPCYCGESDCGSTDIGTMDIMEWEKIYKKTYHKRFISK